MKKKTIDKLKEITDSIPQHLKDSLMKKRLAMPVSKEIMERAIQDPDIPEEKKERLRNLIVSGYMDEMEDYYDENVAMEIDRYVENKIMEAINNKQLPKSNFVGLIKKLKQQAKYELKQRGESGDVTADRES